MPPWTYWSKRLSSSCSKSRELLRSIGERIYTIRHDAIARAARPPARRPLSRLCRGGKGRGDADRADVLARRLLGRDAGHACDRLLVARARPAAIVAARARSVAAGSRAGAGVLRGVRPDGRGPATLPGDVFRAPAAAVGLAAVRPA